MFNERVRRRMLPALGISAGLVAGAIGIAGASSHREAPLSSQDPVTDLTDVYAFVSPDAPDTVTLIANVIPFEQPAGGPNFYRFGDDVLYQLNVDNDGDARADKRYRFRFTTTTANPGTFLYNTGQVTSVDDPDLNVRQTYTLTEVDEHGRTRVLGRNLPVAPTNVGERSTPDYERNLGSAAVRSVEGGITTFAGPRDDAFFVDLGSIFDLGGLRPFNPAHVIPLPAEDGKDYVAGLNVHTLAVRIPIAQLVDDDPVIGVWATTYRKTTRIAKDDGSLKSVGSWVQVSRLGQPLVNEVVIPLGKKDRFNASRPADDTQFLDHVITPELANLIPVLYPGVNVPTTVDAGLGLGGREDIATIFLTGIPGVNQPMNVKPSEMLRLNTSIPQSGFPNGRTLTDDVVDIEIRALAGATPFSPEFNISPNKDLGDGVDANDVPLSATFPYLASPKAGTD
jgi:Domain of unknown function (DUF4331)